MNTRILLIEDDPKLAKGVSEYLGRQGYLVDIVAHGDQVEIQVRMQTYDLLILDVVLPGKNGFELCKNLRQAYHGGIIMLTARDEEIDQVLGLELGADAYLVKPIMPRVLLAYITAILRRLEQKKSASQSSGQHKSKQLTFGLLSISYDTRSTYLDGTLIELTSGEFDILWMLACAAGEIVTRDHISNQLRGFNYDGMDRSIDLRISRIRKKLNDNPLFPEKIKTIRGKGYLFNPAAWEIL